MGFPGGGLPAPTPRGPLEWGVGAPGSENSPSLAPSQSSPGRRELISRLSPRPLPLPPFSSLSLLPTLPPGPAPTRPCQAPCPGGCQAPGGTGGACEGGLTPAGPRCPHILIPPEVCVGHGVGSAHVLTHTGCGSPKGAGWGSRHSDREKVEKCPWGLGNALRPSWIPVTASRDPSYFGIMIPS